MKLSVVYPQAEFGTDPDRIGEYALRAEELGYDQLVAYDHVLGADPEVHRLTGPYTHETNFMEPFVLFGYLSAITTTIELVMGVLVLPQRQTALVAKQAATLDLLSRGRLVLGVGVGWNQVEYQALGEDFSSRGRRMEEQIPLLRSLWSEQLVDFTGEFDTISAAGICPRPSNNEIPIWMGGWDERVLRRLGRLGDGWIAGSGNAKNRATWSPDRIQRPEDLERSLGIVRKAALESERDPNEIAVSILVSSTGFDGLEEWDPIGWALRAKHWKAAGASHALLSTLDLGFSQEEHLEALDSFHQAWIEVGN
jgi:probable F420-dependent oxidoreductase